MKFIFLDIDGVVVLFQGNGKFEADCMQNLKKIIDKTSAKIVLSSSWRTIPQSIEEVNNTLKKFGMDHIYSKTPEDNDYQKYFNGYAHPLESQRVTEILNWITEAISQGTDIESFVAIDDLNLESDARIQGNFVLTHPHKGILESTAEKCIKILQ